MKTKPKSVQVELGKYLLVEHTIEFSKTPLTYPQLCKKVKGKATQAEVRAVCEYLMEGKRLVVDDKGRLRYIAKYRMGMAYTPPPEERRKPLLKALEEAWDAAPSMRLTQLLICAKVFPHCDHTSRVWSDWDEETTKKLLAFAAMVKKEKRDREKK